MEVEHDKCLKILHVVGIMDRGGTEALIMSLYRSIDRKEIQFDFVVHDHKRGEYDEEIEELGGRIFYIPRYRGVNHFAYVKEWNTFFESHPEYSIIHGHMRSTAAIYLKIAKKHQRIAIAHSHNTGSRGNILEKIVKRVMQYPICYVADYFFACSTKAGIWLFGKNVCRSDRFQVLNNGIDSQKYIFDEDTRNKKRRELGIEKQFVIGHIGNFSHQKNHSFLIDIFEEIYKRNSECLLVLIGGGELKLQQEIQEKANRKGIKENVKFLGSRADVNEILNAFDLFLFPSLYEGLGIVAIEAQANGLVCILSDVIPREVEVTEHVEFVSLKESAAFWAERALAYQNNCIRSNMEEKIHEAGYDIREIACKIEKFYWEINKK